MSSVSILELASMARPSAPSRSPARRRSLTGVKFALFGARNPADVEETNMNLFRLDTSIFASAELADVIEEERTAGLPRGRRRRSG